MKKPYITECERQLIIAGTLAGDHIMLRFRVKQLKRAIIEVLKKEKKPKVKPPKCPNCGHGTLKEIANNHDTTEIKAEYLERLQCSSCLYEFVE